jgi:hypothetical protein
LQEEREINTSNDINSLELNNKKNQIAAGLLNGSLEIF